MGARFEEVQAKIHAFCEAWPDAEWGEAHIILSDYNLEDCWIADIRGRLARLPTPESRATLAFLDELMTIPEDDRCPDRSGGRDWSDDEDDGE